MKSIAKRSQWDLVDARPLDLPAFPILTRDRQIWRGGRKPRDQPRPCARSTGGVTAIEMNSDHPFADHRIALARRR